MQRIIISLIWIHFFFSNGYTEWKVQKRNVWSEVGNCFSKKISWVGQSAGKILKTEDGGVTWLTKQLPDYAPSGRISCIQFVDSLCGFLGTVERDFFITTDGGETWTRFPQDINIVTLFFCFQGYGLDCQRLNP
ncbi:hypothetical protein JW960_09455 [candidate division KSB1 bacterium]|nr:hypothetical protein [candidate division KSB1 bacterium]